jgi:hypothetical protein
MVLAQHFCSGCWGWKKAQQSLTPAADWLDCLIGPGGLLVVVSYKIKAWHLLQDITCSRMNRKSQSQLYYSRSSSPLKCAERKVLNPCGIWNPAKACLLSLLCVKWMSQLKAFPILQWRYHGHLGVLCCVRSLLGIN